MKSKFTSAPAGIMAKARGQLDDVPLGDEVTAPAATQKHGASGKVADLTAHTLPLKGQRLMSAKRIRIRPGFERAEAEYSDTEFAELVESIKENGVNIDPIDIRLLNGVSGFDAELLAGTRRLRACQQLGIDVSANVRECDDRMADRIHELENKHRKNKSPYSRALQYKAMLDSGKYQGVTDLAANLQTRKQEVSDCLSLITKAPAGMWDKVSDAGTIKTTQVRPLMAGYGSGRFAEMVNRAGALTVVELVELAKEALKPAVTTPPAGPDTSKARLGDKRGDYLVYLPKGLTKEHAEGVVAVVQKYLEGKAK